MTGRLTQRRSGAALRFHGSENDRHGARLVWRHALLRAILLTAVARNIAWFVLPAAVILALQVRTLRRLPAPAD